MSESQAQFDVVVVGAGPAGSVAARQAALLGCGSVVLLDQEEFPRHKICAGGISSNACGLLRRLGLRARVGRAGQVIRSIRLVSVSDRQITIRGGPPGLVLNRQRFDQILVDAAVRAGVEFRPGVRVDGLLKDSGRVVGVRTGQGDVLGRWVVAAGGARWHCRWGPRPHHVLRTRIAWFEGARIAPARLEIVYDRDFLPGYGWLFPESETRVNVGVLIGDGRAAVGEMFARLINRHLRAQLAGAEQVGPVRTHPICSLVSVGHNAPPGVLLAGEANGLTSVATGEGIYYALRSGELAAHALRTAGERGLGAVQTAQLYERSLRRAFQVRFACARFFSKAGPRLLVALSSFGDTALIGRTAGAAMMWA